MFWGPEAFQTVDKRLGEIGGGSMLTHVQLFSRVKSKLSFKSIICSFFFTRLYEQIIDLYIIYLVNLGRLCIQYFSNILVADCNNSLSKLRQIMS